MVWWPLTMLQIHRLIRALHQGIMSESQLWTMTEDQTLDLAVALVDLQMILDVMTRILVSKLQSASGTVANDPDSEAVQRASAPSHDAGPIGGTRL